MAREGGQVDWLLLVDEWNGRFGVRFFVHFKDLAVAKYR
jgi:hypothetical protein